MKYSPNNDDEQLASGQAAMAFVIVGIILAIIMIVIKKYA
jgi:hypothetical protein